MANQTNQKRQHKEKRQETGKFYKDTNKQTNKQNGMEWNCTLHYSLKRKYLLKQIEKCFFYG